VGLSDLQVSTLVERYRRERDRYEKLAAFVARLLSRGLHAANIPHVPTFRSKTPTSLRGKLIREGDEYVFESLETELSNTLKDLAGVRILLYRPSDVDTTCGLVADLFELAGPTERFAKDFLAADGYQARHRVVRLRDEHLVLEPMHANLERVPCEIQIVTIADHLWNELEHDIVYKTPHGKPTAEQRSLLKVLRDQANAVRTTVAELMGATERHRSESLSTIESGRDLDDVLKRITKNRFQGDFERLLELLEAVMRDVTPLGLEEVLAPGSIETGRQLLAASTINVAEDSVEILVAALWSKYGADFSEVVRSWPGRRGPISRVVLALAKDPAEATL
jgi:ppGpp synthetase/RelA/SpoT-type nucleotidyltranferase